jgi:UDP-glucose:(heptosyl)LPS alpha-1,3-glucosyltransferase
MLEDCLNSIFQLPLAADEREIIVIDDGSDTSFCNDEAAGSVLIEAIATGLPVICTELCGFSTYVRASNAGHVLPGTFHQEELNAVLESLLMHRENLKFLSREALEYASHINLTGRSKAIVDFLEKIQHGIH